MFKTQQAAREAADKAGMVRRVRRELFASLDRAEGILGKQRYIAGNQLTEVRLLSLLLLS
jgi:glutathionyl-hydroquinone reductase